ncbi:MAG: flagellar biosynthesis protein FlhF [Azospira oryzae]|nr:MAG: flagellar biosynthesis protein FlhF [Azospira oryzae]PZP82089.1 MAG: flagellar biosynthesis protein FlhF [Azospira oryzae]
MKVSRFIAKTSREALRQVKEALGPDAVVLSNRAVEGGVEIMAMRSEEIAPLTQPPEAPASSPAGGGATAPLGAKPSGAEELMRRLTAEIQTLRGIVEDQLAGLAWSGVFQQDPVKAAALREMLAAGFSPSLSKLLLERLPKNYSREQAIAWMRAALAHNLAVLADEAEVLDRGGVYALMGPTGVGKTTTTAKLAARFVVRHGAQKLGLVTTDGYRIGGHDQLRLYGQILGVQVYTARDGESLARVLDYLQHKHLILIDTVGMSQRDRLVAEQVAMLRGCGAEVRRLLLLNATCHGDTLEDVYLAYRDGGLAGCVLTKLDEAIAAGAALDVAIRHKLKVFYVSSGQRVPEDLHLPNAEALVRRSFSGIAARSPHAPGETELAALMSLDAARRARAEVAYG